MGAMDWDEFERRGRERRERRDFPPKPDWFTTAISLLLFFLLILWLVWGLMS